MLYELTITLNPKIYKYTALEQFKRTSKIVYKIFSLSCRYDVTVVAELTKQENIHYHCMVELKDRPEKSHLINVFRKHGLLGRYTLEPIKYEHNYIDYMKKDISQTFEVLGRCPIVVDDYGIFDYKEEKDNLCICKSNRHTRSYILKNFFTSEE